MLLFEWDPAKARTNFRKHGVTFEDAIGVFSDPNALFGQDRIENGETRWQAIGLMGTAVLLVVAHTLREEGKDEVVRVISARATTRKERKHYGQTCS